MESSSRRKTPTAAEVLGSALKDCEQTWQMACSHDSTKRLAVDGLPTLLRAVQKQLSLGDVHTAALASLLLGKLWGRLCLSLDFVTNMPWIIEVLSTPENVLSSPTPTTPDFQPILNAVARIVAKDKRREAGKSQYEARRKAALERNKKLARETFDRLREKDPLQKLSRIYSDVGKRLKVSAKTVSRYLKQ